MIRSNYWLTRQQQRKAYYRQLIRYYAMLAAVLVFAIALVVVSFN